MEESDGDVEFAHFPENHRFQVLEGCHWKDVRAKSANIGHALQKAMRCIEQANPDPLQGIFGNVRWTNKDCLFDALLKFLIEHFSSLTIDNEHCKADSEGYAYEYLIKKCADLTNKKVGEFYTPRSLVALLYKGKKMARFSTVKKQNVPCMRWQDCIAKTDENGKPGTTVLDHCTNVAAVAEALFELIPEALKDLFGENPIAVTGVHDVGKIAPGFQIKILSKWISEFCPRLASHGGGFETLHALIGEAALNLFLDARNNPSKIAAIVGAHHGDRDRRAPLSDLQGDFGGDSWAEERRKFIEHIQRQFGALPSDISDIGMTVLSGLVCVSDWIGSDEAFFPPSGFISGTNIKERAKSAVEKCGWRKVEVKSGFGFDEVFGFPPNKIQERFVDSVAGPGLYILEAPMGMGKTEAALFAAYKLISEGKNSGFYFGLPTRLTSDKIHERVRPFVQKICADTAGVILAHGMSWLNCFDSGGEAFSRGNSWFNPRKRSLLYPFSVGTIDQALLAVLKVKHYFVRCFGLAGKVVILDEVHSYDVYTSSILVELVRALLKMRCSVVILSATLSGSRRKALLALKDSEDLQNEEYPLVTSEIGGKYQAIPVEISSSKKIRIEFEANNDLRIGEIAVQKALEGHCVVCIANTVAKAQSWFNRIKASMPEGAFEVGLLHSKFPQWRRRQLESFWIGALGKKGARPDGCVLVATQVVEQSVDIDADFMITELAPADMLLQRIGRLWRHDRDRRPCKFAEVAIVTGDVESAESKEEMEEALGKSNCLVYSPYVLWRTFQVFEGLGEISIPGDIRPKIEQTYRETPEKEDPAFIEEFLNVLKRRKNSLEMLANSAKAGVDAMLTTSDDESASTRYNEIPTIDAVLAKRLQTNGRDAEIVLSNDVSVKVSPEWKDFSATKQLYENIVGIPAYKLKGVKTPPFLSRHFFSKTALLVISDAKELLMDGNPTGLGYDDIHGLQTTADRRGTPRVGGSEFTGYSDFEDSEDFFNELDW